MQFNEDGERQRKLLLLTEMGFEFDYAQTILEASGWDLEEAIQRLTHGSGGASWARSNNSSLQQQQQQQQPSIIPQDLLEEHNAYVSYHTQTSYAESRRQPVRHIVYPEIDSDSHLGEASPLLSHGNNGGDVRHNRNLPPLPPSPPVFGPRCNLKIMLVYLAVVSLVMIFCAAWWVAWVFQNEAVCGTDLDSAIFNTYPDEDSGTRILSGNSCPGYDWTSQSTPGSAGDDEFTYSIPLSPVNCTEPTEVGIYDPLFGHIGYALNGVPLFSPSDGDGRDAVEYEYTSFDQCGGHVKEKSLFINKLFPSTSAPGDYHYHAMPGDSDPDGHASNINLNFTLCDDVTQWYNESEDSHSPMVGFLLDGIPIYGPRGAQGLAPTDLDQCGGHASDLDFYHYHFKSQYPYSVDCLWGRTDGQSNAFLNNYDSCVESSVQSNYSSISSMTYTYGGSGNNARDSVGCLTLISVGSVLFIYAILHYAWITISEQKLLPPPPSNTAQQNFYGAAGVMNTNQRFWWERVEIPPPHHHSNYYYRSQHEYAAEYRSPRRYY